MSDRLQLLSPAGEPFLVANEDLNDSDKSFTVPLTYVYEVQWIYVELTTTATVGNRQLLVEIQDPSGDVIMQVMAAAVQAASLAHEYTFGYGLTQYDGADATKHCIPLPRLILGPRHFVRVYDAAAVDAAADDMVVQMFVTRRYTTPFVAEDAINIDVPRAPRLILTGQGPTDVELTQRSPAAASLTITAYAPFLNLIITQATLTITASTPTVSNPGRLPAAAALDLSGYQPTVGISS